MALSKTQEAILAVLTELQDAGFRATTTTSLVKFVYLLDYSFAKESAGKTLTETAWTFSHFGPYAATVSADLDGLIRLGLVDEQAGQSRDKDYYLYQIGADVAKRTFEAIGLVNRAASRLRQFLRDFASDQSKLLNFVYFHTEPMEDARPEERLDFSACRQDLFAETRPVQLKALPAEAVKAYKTKLEERRKQRQKVEAIRWEGPYDDLYIQSMQWLDEELDASAVGKAGTLHL